MGKKCRFGQKRLLYPNLFSIFAPKVIIKILGIDAFLRLEQYLEHCNENRKVLFFDEMPWMDTQGSEFVAELEYFWANWVQNRDDIVFTT